MAPSLVPQALPWPIRVRRWWASPTHWALIAGAIMNAGTGALDALHYIGLSGPELIAALIVGNVAIHLLGAVLNYFTTTIIGDAHEVATTERANG